MTTALVGSLQAIAQRDGVSLAESFLSADAIVIVDTSGSMDVNDVPGFRGSRYEAACAELKRLQASLPGKVAVIAFSSSVQFAPAGVPPYLGAGTDLASALRFVHPADDTGITLIVISDGQPDDTSETLQVARTFTSPIQTVYIGPEGGPGQAFLAKLAKATGGQSSRNAVQQIAERVERLMLSAGGAQ